MHVLARDRWTSATQTGCKACTLAKRYISPLRGRPSTQNLEVTHPFPCNPSLMVYGPAHASHNATRTKSIQAVKSMTTRDTTCAQRTTSSRVPTKADDAPSAVAPAPAPGSPTPKPVS
jgi:hypothetical protein